MGRMIRQSRVRLLTCLSSSTAVTPQKRRGDKSAASGSCVVLGSPSGVRAKAKTVTSCWLQLTAMRRDFLWTARPQADWPTAVWKNSFGALVIGVQPLERRALSLTAAAIVRV